MDSETLRTLFEPRGWKQRRPTPSCDPDAPKAQSTEAALTLSRTKDTPNLRANHVGLTLTLTLTWARPASLTLTLTLLRWTASTPTRARAPARIRRLPAQESGKACGETASRTCVAVAVLVPPESRLPVSDGCP